MSLDLGSCQCPWSPLLWRVRIRFPSVTTIHCINPPSVRSTPDADQHLSNLAHIEIVGLRFLRGASAAHIPVHGPSCSVARTGREASECYWNADCGICAFFLVWESRTNGASTPFARPPLDSRRFSFSSSIAMHIYNTIPHWPRMVFVM